MSVSTRMSTSVQESHTDFYKRWHRLAKPYFEWQFQQLRDHLGNRFGDIGCGIGNFVDFFIDHELYVGIDSDTSLIHAMRMSYANRKNMEFYCADILSDECVELLRDKCLDTILCINVLEHIENDQKAISNMLSVLPTGGRLCILVPAFESLFGTLDALDNHYRRYNKRSFIDTIFGLPIEVKTMYYFNFVGAFGWFLKGRVVKAKSQEDENYKLMNVLVPIVSRVENLCKPPFGLSLVAILEKR